MLPVIKWEKFKGLKSKKGLLLKENAEFAETSLTSDQDAFFMIASAGLISPPVVNDGDLLLIEPNTHYRDSDLVLYQSNELTTLGRIYFYPRMTILLPLSEESPPHVLKKEDVRRPGVRIFRVSEIRRYVL